MNQKQFTGFLSSVENPGQLALTMKGFTALVISIAVFYASVKGLDTAAVTSNVQYFLDLGFSFVSSGAMCLSILVTFFGLARKGWHAVFAKPVLTVPAAVAAAVTTDTATPTTVV